MAGAKGNRVSTVVIPLNSPPPLNHHLEGIDEGEEEYENVGHKPGGGMDENIELISEQHSRHSDEDDFNDAMEVGAGTVSQDPLLNAVTQQLAQPPLHAGGEGAAGGGGTQPVSPADFLEAVAQHGAQGPL